MSSRDRGTRTRLHAASAAFLAGAILVSCAAMGCTSSSEARHPLQQSGSAVADVSSLAVRPRNIILLISDGCGPASFTLARDFIRSRMPGAQLALDAIQVGSVQTFSSDALITDSASSATAYACGIKTRNGMIGMGPDTTAIESVTEIAEKIGKSTGLVATSRITHATPASFAAHVPNRNMEAEIAAQMMSSGVDLLLGGGRRFFEPESSGGSRTDDRDLLAEAATAGYTIVRTRTEFDVLRRLPAIGLFTKDHLPYEVDRDASTVPSLAEMTSRAIELLSSDPDGFFLMVEGSRIDHAAHVNDLAGHLHDIIAYDDAVRAALDFAAADGETLLISVSDHETGGLTIGRAVDGRSIYTWKPEVAGRLTASSDTILAAIFDRGRSAVDAIGQYTGIRDLTDLEVKAMSDASRSAANIVLGDIIGRRALIGWTTGGHTAVDVNLYAFGPGSRGFAGHLDNADLGRKLIRALQ